jgi:hypothetical protein
MNYHSRFQKIKFPVKNFFVIKLAQSSCYNAEHYNPRAVFDTTERIIKRDIIGGETPKFTNIVNVKQTMAHENKKEE